MWLQSLSAVILELKKIKSVTVSTFSPSICHEMMGLDATVFIFSMLSVKPAFSRSCFTLLMRPFSSSPLLALRVLSCTYLIFLPTVLIPAWDSSSLAFHMMFSEYNLNKQGHNIQPCRSSFKFEPVSCSPSSSINNCCCFICIQVSQETG